jgi:hypothetical protein
VLEKRQLPPRPWGETDFDGLQDCEIVCPLPGAIEVEACRQSAPGLWRCLSPQLAGGGVVARAGRRSLRLHQLQQVQAQSDVMSDWQC